MQFIGREYELARIQEKLCNDRTECMLIYGRRRVGKSELVKEALKGLEATVIRYVCRKAPFAQNLAGLSKAVSQAFADKFVNFTQLADLLEYVCHKASQQKVVLFIDEYPFLRGDAEAIDSEFQIAIDTWQQRQNQPYTGQIGGYGSDYQGFAHQCPGQSSQASLCDMR